jgi:predicted ATPase
MDKILRKPNIWDLHIHTPLGTPTKKNYGGVSAEEFVDEIIKIYEAADKKIGMISFTDHNRINAEAYQVFQQKSNIVIIPGIEVDVYLTENDKSSKHIIFYFEEIELDNIYDLKKLIEEYIDENTKVYFEPFVMHLIYNKKKFAVSPHAFKQDKRGIDFDWFDEVSADKGTNEFSGLFFPFWEAGGKSDICKAIEFLNEQYGEEENMQAIIAFSDSADYEKLRRYIENPHQYFLCLNSFKGLLLAGSDKSRIIYEYEDRPQSNPSEKIKRVIISDDLKRLKKNNRIELELSDRLNVIVGGRGKGKSALLDAIVYKIDEKKIENTGRAAFVKKFDTQIINFNEVSLSSDTNIVYFSQSYINKLFDGNSQEKLESFFKKQFSDIDTISYGISDIKMTIEKSKEVSSIDDLNVADDLKNLIYIGRKSANLSVKSKNAKKISISVEGEGYDKYIRGLLPNNDKIWDEQLNAIFKQFVNQLVENIVRYNYDILFANQFPKLMKKKIDAQKKKRSSEDKKKGESKERIEQKLRFLYNKELERIRQINKLYEIDINRTEVNIQYSEYSGEKNNRFFFVSVSNKEHPVEYAKRLIVESVNKSMKKGFDKKRIDEIFREYATTDELSGKTKDSITFIELIRKISDLEELRADKIQRIIYKSEEEYIDLHNTSPGTQTNAVMEFILHTDSTAPLFIDQPEDNIDNEARYAQLTRWVRTQKYKRQIILVTHDANIVINGDAECVIIANHTSDKFSYEYGALEYGDILDKAAVILDGGKTAIHRRIEKYGE